MPARRHGSNRAVDLGVDLGTRWTRIASRSGVAAEWPTLVVHRRGRALLGTEARRSARHPEARVVRPVVGGVVRDPQAATLLLRGILREVCGARARPRLVVCVSPQAKGYDRSVLLDAARAAGAREVIGVASPLTAALGAGLPLTEPGGNLIADVGAGGAEVALVSLGGLVRCAAGDCGGDAMDRAIAEWFAVHGGMRVGSDTAERLKRHLGSASTPQSRPPLRIEARSLLEGTPRELEVHAEDVTRAIAPVVAQLRSLIARALSQAPPELCADVLDRGMILCGGGAALYGLARAIRADLGIPVLRPEVAAHVGVLGAAGLIDDPELRERLRDASAAPP